MSLSLHDLLDEHVVASAYSIDLISGLDSSQTHWRPNKNSSAIAWHLGHQGVVNHFMLRNLTAAEKTFDAAFDSVFDSATAEPARGDLPPLDEIVDYRNAISESTRRVVGLIESGDVGAPNQLPLIAEGMLLAIINHEYQHAKWIGEVRSSMIDLHAPSPLSNRLIQVDGYYMIAVSP
ncbi:MAG: DinB family protein [Acidimicrobiales bacterium]